MKVEWGCPAHPGAKYLTSQAWRDTHTTNYHVVPLGAYHTPLQTATTTEAATDRLVGCRLLSHPNTVSDAPNAKRTAYTMLLVHGHAARSCTTMA